MVIDNVEAEQAVLGSILIDARCLPDVSAVLTPEDFGMEVNKAIYRAALELSARGQAVDVITILEQTRKAGTEVPNTYMMQLMDTTPTAANVMEYAPIVREHALRRGVLELATRIQTGANEGDDPHDLLAELITGASALEQEGTNSTLISPLELASRWMDHRAAVESGECKVFVPTGFRDYDYITGGLIAGGMLVLAARPGNGKTTFALNIADSVAKNVGAVLYVSLEMDDTQLMAKRIARETGIDSKKVMSKQLTPAENEKHAEATERLAALPMYINRKPNASVADIAAMARQVKGLKLIVIDYLGIADPDKNTVKSPRYEQVTVNSREIKQLARRMNIPILTLCQINREVEKRADKRPNLSDLRDSGAIEQDADTVTFLYRRDYYRNEADKDPFTPDETECIVAKNRHGGIGDCRLAFYPAVSKFTTANSDPRSGHRMGIQTGNI